MPKREDLSTLTERHNETTEGTLGKSDIVNNEKEGNGESIE